MRKIILCIMLVFCGALVSSAQSIPCPTGLICYTQAQNNDIKSKLDELLTLRDAYAKLLAERTLTDAERAAAANVVKIAQDTIAILERGIADRDKVVELQQKALQLYADLVQKLTDQLNKPKSAWSKFLTALKEIAYLATGVIIGRQF